MDTSEHYSLLLIFVEMYGQYGLYLRKGKAKTQTKRVQLHRVTNDKWKKKGMVLEVC